MKTILATATLLLALTACDVPVAANNECHRHGFKTGSAEYNDCMAKLKSSEQELRKAD